MLLNFAKLLYASYNTRTKFPVNLAKFLLLLYGKISMQFASTESAKNVF
jgi:hypothetical protein